MEPPDITEAVLFCVNNGRFLLAWKILLIRHRVVRLNRAKMVPYAKMQRVALNLAVIQREFASKCT